MAMSIDGSNGLTFPSTAIQGDAGIGYGQTWQNVTGSRALGTTYTNSTGKPIMVNIDFNATTSNVTANITVGGVLAAQTTITGYMQQLSVIVPNGATYVTNSSNLALINWSELR